MSIKLPVVAKGRCESCGYVTEYNFSEYGSEESCIECNSAPVFIREVK
jgi:hypothetical protein